jgi:hypothetical protein
MRRVLVLAALLAACAVVPAPAGAVTPAAASGTVATPSSAGCSTVSYGGRGYVLYKRGVQCSWARRWVRRVHRTKEGPRRWDCSSGSDFRTGGYCERGAKHFGWHPGD